MIERGADLEAKDILEMTPFLMAVTRGAVESAKMLVDHGADIFATDFSLNSAVHLAITCKKPEMLKSLIEVDKDRVLVQMKDKDKRNVLHLACGQDNSEVFIISLTLSSIYLWYINWDHRAEWKRNLNGLLTHTRNTEKTEF